MRALLLGFEEHEIPSMHDFCYVPLVMTRLYMDVRVEVKLLPSMLAHGIATAGPQQFQESISSVVYRLAGQRVPHEELHNRYFVE